MVDYNPKNFLKVAEKVLTDNGYKKIYDNLGSAKLKKSYSVYGQNCIMGCQMEDYRLVVRNEDISRYFDVPKSTRPFNDDLQVNIRGVSTGPMAYSTSNLSDEGIYKMLSNMVRSFDKLSNIELFYKNHVNGKVSYKDDQSQKIKLKV